MAGYMVVQRGQEGMSMLDSILEIGASFDYITPLASILSDIVNGHSHKP